MAAISAGMRARDRWKGRGLEGRRAGKNRDCQGAESSSSDDDDASRAKRIRSSPEWYVLPPLPPFVLFRILLGILFVTFLCPALRAYALFEIPLPVALTLGCVGPIYSLPVGWIVDGERYGGKVVGGTVAAVVGVGMLCFMGV